MGEKAALRGQSISGSGWDFTTSIGNRWSGRFDRSAVRSDGNGGGKRTPGSSPSSENSSTIIANPICLITACVIPLGSTSITRCSAASNRFIKILGPLLALLAGRSTRPDRQEWVRAQDGGRGLASFVTLNRWVRPTWNADAPSRDKGRVSPNPAPSVGYGGLFCGCPRYDASIVDAGARMLSVPMTLTNSAWTSLGCSHCVAAP